MLGILIVMDLIWFFVMSAVWSQEIDNEYWKGQSGLRSFALIFSWVEIALKGFIIFYLFVDFKAKNPNEVNYLFNFDYSTKSTSSSNSQGTPQDDDWNKNPYGDN